MGHQVLASGKHNTPSEKKINSMFESGLTGGFLLLQNFSVAVSVSPHVSLLSPAEGGGI